MSEHLFRKPASEVTLPEAALIAGLIRAPSTLSPWSNYDGALERSHVVLAQMREQGFITPEQEAAARAVRPAHPAVPAVARRRERLGEGLPAPAVPQRVRRRPSAGLAGADDVRSPTCRRGGAGGRRGPAAPQHAGTRGGARRDRSADRRHPGDGRRRRLRGAARSIARRAAAVSRARRSSRSSTRRRWRTAFRRSRCCRAWRSVTAPGDPEWMPRNAEHETRADALTLREALDRVEQRRRRGAAAAGRHRRGADARVGCRPARICRTCRRWRSAPGW